VRRTLEIGLPQALELGMLHVKAIHGHQRRRPWICHVQRRDQLRRQRRFACTRPTGNPDGHAPAAGLLGQVLRFPGQFGQRIDWRKRQSSLKH
jgi:hypothetical protein